MPRVPSRLDLAFLVQDVGPAGGAELLQRELLRRLLLVLGARVVLPLAGVADQGDQIAHVVPLGAHDRIRTGDLFLTKEVLYRLSYVGKRETGIEPATPSLEGSCSAI